MAGTHSVRPVAVIGGGFVAFVAARTALPIGRDSGLDAGEAGRLAAAADARVKEALDSARAEAAGLVPLVPRIRRRGNRTAKPATRWLSNFALHWFPLDRLGSQRLSQRAWVPAHGSCTVACHSRPPDGRRQP
jgi:hypothetical protein